MNARRRVKISARLFKLGCRATLLASLLAWACIQLHFRDDPFEESSAAVDVSVRLQDHLPSTNSTTAATTTAEFHSNIEANTSDAQPYERPSLRTLYGIFSYDSPNEAELRAANRGTHLNHYIKNRRKEKRADVICKLNVLLARPELAKDHESCQVIYTFVLGGLEGSEDNPKLREKSSAIGRDMVPDSKTRCLYDDPDCGGADINQWTMERPMSVSSDSRIEKEMRLQDLTFLSILESHEYGKTDTWYTYATLLARQRRDLKIGFVGKIDSDNFIRWPSFFQYLKHNYEETLKTEQYIYGGWFIPKDECSGKAYSGLCADGRFIGDGFASGAHNYISTELATKVFLETPLARRKEVWFVGEDMQLANMVYSTKIRPIVINHRGGLGHAFINVHCKGDPGLMRFQFLFRQDRQFTAAMSEAAKKAEAKDSGT